MKNILNSEEGYSFSTFFELKIEAQDLAKKCGYSFERKWLNLPQYEGELDRSPQTQERIEEILPHVSLTSDRAKREILVSPIIRDLIYYTKANVRIEYLSNHAESFTHNHINGKILRITISESNCYETNSATFT